MVSETALLSLIKSDKTVVLEVPDN